MTIATAKKITSNNPANVKLAAAIMTFFEFESPFRFSPKPVALVVLRVPDELLRCFPSAVVVASYETEQ